MPRKVLRFVNRKIAHLKSLFHAQLSKKSILKMYLIEGTINKDKHYSFRLKSSYPSFQSDFEKFKELIRNLLATQQSVSIYKFGDGDFFFLKGIEKGSAKPGKRAISHALSKIDLAKFNSGANLCNFYTCEIYPENRTKFKEVINRNIDFPAEYQYALIANKWLFKKLNYKIGIIGASEKLDLIEKLMQYPEYQKYLGIGKFFDYIRIPQKFACDNLEMRLIEIEQQLKNSKSELFLVGIGHLKSGVLHKMPSMKGAVFLDVGSGIDALAGIIDENRPYFGDWINYQIPKHFDYSKLDLLQYEKNRVVNLD